VHVVVVKLARVAGATAVGLTAGFVGNAVPAVSAASNLTSAEAVASRFVSGFESFSYQDPSSTTDLADLATPRLAALLSSTPQGATGPALVAEKFTATAAVVGFEVESDTPTTVDLLARTDIRISTVTGSSATDRLIPVSLATTPAGWKVSAVDGLTVTPPPGTTVPPSGAPATPPTPPGSTTPPTTTTTTATTPAGSSGPTGPVTAVGDVPAADVAWMQAAVAAQCPGLPWTVLAGIAKVESDFGKSTLPGVRSGANPMGAEGPMQFEPATFAAYGIVAPGGADPASPYDPADAFYSAAHLLCADGGGNPAHLYAAVFDYNHSDAYVSLVLAYANEYAQIATDGTAPGVVERGLGSVIVAEAETFLGTPYVWGGENPRTGFDCSGLVQWVYAEAGINLPRVAQDQYDHGPHLAAGATLYPGDLVFFGGGPNDVEHVGIYVGNGEMIDAPYTGAVVRFDRVATVPLGFVGATRPEIPDMTVGSGVPVIGTTPPQGGSAPTGGHQGTGPGHRPPPGRTHPGGTSTGSTPTGRHHPTTTTTPPGPTTTGPGRHRPTTTTTTSPTTTTTAPTGPTTTTTRPGRHHPTTTTTSPPPPSTTTTTSTTTPLAGGESSDAGTSTTTTSSPTVTTTVPTTSATTVPTPGRHHGRGG
jgi:cell wall-associated NlpC family hydrolase